MPPQQPHGLLDFFDQVLGFGAHRLFPHRDCSACSVPELVLQPSRYGVMRSTDGCSNGKAPACPAGAFINMDSVQ
jgi:hypothetical protein